MDYPENFRYKKQARQLPGLFFVSIIINYTSSSA